MSASHASPGQHSYTLFIVSGGSGASGEQLVHTVLAQFPEERVQVVTLSNVRQASQVEEAVARAHTAGGTLVHTMVNEEMRLYLTSLAAAQGVPEIDLMGPLIGHLQQHTGQAPLGKPGLYRQLNQAYFDRVAAIEYSMAHDDGQRPEGWAQAEIMILGVSRAGKTPLSLYLSVLGWRVANLPLVPGLPLTGEIFNLDPRRVFGLTIDEGDILALRAQRQRRLGVTGTSDYTDPEKVMEELAYAEGIYKRGGFTRIHVSDKPIETTADEIIRLVTSRFKTR